MTSSNPRHQVEPAVTEELEQVLTRMEQRIDVTQFVPGLRVRRALARVRPPFSAVIDPAVIDPAVGSDQQAARAVAPRRNRRQLHLV